MTLAQLSVLATLAGALHFVQIPGMLVFWSRVLRLGAELDRLAPVTRRIVYVLATTVVLTVLGTGAIVTATATSLAAGGPLALALCTFLGAFWSFRTLCQCYYAGVWPKTTAGRVSHQALLALFAFQAALYAVLACAPRA